MNWKVNMSFLASEWLDEKILFQFMSAWTAAKKLPFNHLRLWEMSSGSTSGTSVSAFASLTYLSTQFSFLFATISKHRILSSARYLLLVKEYCRTMFASETFDLPCIDSPLKYASNGAPWIALYLYAENAPGNTEINPNTDSSGLSRIFDILYSKFCAATRGLTTLMHPFPNSAAISPHAPPTHPSYKYIVCLYVYHPFQMFAIVWGMIVG